MRLKRGIFTVILAILAMSLISAATQAKQDAAARTKSAQHAVSLADLQKDVATSAAVRQANESKVEDFLSAPQARQAMKKAGLDYEMVKQAVPQLSADELSNLAARADKAQKQFKAGALTNQQLTYIIIALATAVIVILIFKA